MHKDPKWHKQPHSLAGESEATDDGCRVDLTLD